MNEATFYLYKLRYLDCIELITSARGSGRGRGCCNDLCLCGPHSMYRPSGVDCTPPTPTPLSPGGWYHRSCIWRNFLHSAVWIGIWVFLFTLILESFSWMNNIIIIKYVQIQIKSLLKKKNSFPYQLYKNCFLDVKKHNINIISIIYKWLSIILTETAFVRFLGLFLLAWTTRSANSWVMGVIDRKCEGGGCSPTLFGEGWSPFPRNLITGIGAMLKFLCILLAIAASSYHIKF